MRQDSASNTLLPTVYLKHPFPLWGRVEENSLLEGSEQGQCCLVQFELPISYDLPAFIYLVKAYSRVRWSYSLRGGFRVCIIYRRVAY